MRIRIMEALARDTASAKQLSKRFEVSVSYVSYHLSRVLYRECGLVKVVETKPRRGATETFYELDSEAIRGLIDWDSLPAALRETLRGSSLAGFISFAVAAIRDGSLDGRNAVMCWQPVALDLAAWDEVRETVVAAVKRAEDAVAESKKRLRGSGLEAPRVHAVIGLAAFQVEKPTQEDA